MKYICKEHTINFKQKLVELNLKATPGRLELLDVLQHKDEPLSITGIGKFMKGKKADFATIYRNVESLKKLGLVREVSLNRSKAFYELAGKPHHHHLICQGCGLIKDVANCPKPKISTKDLHYAGFKNIEFHSLEFFGNCLKCPK